MAFIDTLHAILPSSAILNARKPKVGPHNNYSVSRQLPPTIFSFADPHFKIMNKEDLVNEGKKILELSDVSVEYLAESIKLQGQSMLWLSTVKDV